MHFTQGARLDTIAPYGTIDQHVNQNLPTVGGSTVSAEFLNALMFEIANVIEFVGMTVEANSATDRTNGFAQLVEAIFESEFIDTGALADEAVTSAKIYDVSLDKISNGKTDLTYVSGTITYQFDLDVDASVFLLGFTETDSATGIEYQADLRSTRTLFEKYDTSVLVGYSQLDNEQLLIRDYSALSAETGRAKLATDGLFFLNSGKSIKHYVGATGLTFALDGIRGDYYLTVVTSIPGTVRVLMAQFTYTDTAAAQVQRSRPGSIEFVAAGGFLSADIRYDADPTAAIVSDAYLTIIYSDS